MPVGKLPLLVQQTYDGIKEIIDAGEFKVSGRLPSENILANRLNVSRATIRTALAKMEYDNLIVRVHGKGTFIKERTIKLETALKEKWDFIPMLEDNGRKVQVELLGLNERAAGDYDAELLNIPSDQTIIELIRLYKADGKGVIYSRNVFPKNLLNKDADPILMEYNCTAYELCERYFKVNAENSLTDLLPVLPNDEMADKLNITTTTPLFLFKDFFLSQDEQILLAGENYMHDRLLKLRFLNS